MDRFFNPSNFNDDNFNRNDEISFHVLENKHEYDFSVVMNYLNVKYRFSLVNFKIYCPILKTDVVIDHH